MMMSMTTTAFAYDSTCTVTIPKGVSAGGYLTLSPYVGLGKNVNVEIVAGLDGMTYMRDEDYVQVAVTRIASNKSYTCTLTKVNYSASIPAAFAGSGDYRVTAHNNSGVEVKIKVYFGSYSG